MLHATSSPYDDIQDALSRSLPGVEPLITSEVPLAVEQQPSPLVFSILSDFNERDLKWGWDTSAWNGVPSTMSGTAAATVIHPLTRESMYDSRLIKQSLVCDPGKVNELWEEKSGLDRWFDADQGALYRMAREAVFPQEKLRGLPAFNRTGAKLKEVADAVDLIRRLTSNGPGAVLDVLGARRAWTEFIFSYLKQLRAEGQEAAPELIRSITVPPSGTQSAEDRRNATTQRKKGHMIVVPNIHRTKDILEPEDIDHIVQFVEADAASIRLVVADGALKIGRDPITGKHLENYQEIINSRSLLSQTLLALRTLRTGGDLVIKLFDTFANFTVSLLYILRQLFESVTVIKPCRSRPVNSERYVACLALKQNRESIVTMLEQAFVAWSTSSDRDTCCPNTLVPLPIMTSDVAFMNSMEKMTVVLCDRQCAALQRVRAEVIALEQQRATSSEMRGATIGSVGNGYAKRQDGLTTRDRGGTVRRGHGGTFHTNIASVMMGDGSNPEPLLPHLGHGTSPSKSHRTPHYPHHVPALPPVAVYQQTKKTTSNTIVMDDRRRRDRKLPGAPGQNIPRGAPVISLLPASSALSTPSPVPTANLVDLLASIGVANVHVRPAAQKAAPPPVPLVTTTQLLQSSHYNGTKGPHRGGGKVGEASGAHLLQALLKTVPQPGGPAVLSSCCPPPPTAPPPPPPPCPPVVPGTPSSLPRYHQERPSRRHSRKVHQTLDASYQEQKKPETALSCQAHPLGEPGTEALDKIFTKEAQNPAAAAGAPSSPSSSLESSSGAIAQGSVLPDMSPNASIIATGMPVS